MRLASLAFFILAAGFAYFLSQALWSGEISSGSIDFEPASRPRSGAELIQSIRCRLGEEKQVTVKGVEDNFLANQVEIATAHPRLAEAGIKFSTPASNFDGVNADSAVTDYFEFSPSTQSATLILRLKPIAENSNDFLTVGDLTGLRSNVEWSQRAVVSNILSEIQQQQLWNVYEDLYWVSLEDLPVFSVGSLLDVVQASSGTRVLDVQVSDDTAVDFMAVVACLKPNTRKGITFAATAPGTIKERGFASFACEDYDDPEHNCNPFVGDVDCDQFRPLLCYADRSVPAPLPEEPDDYNLIQREWSGGEFAATGKVQASSFKTITDADQYCASHFGPEWRVAEWHLSGRARSMAGYSNSRNFSGRYWIDIRGAPYGTCWSRDVDRAK